jgi:protein-disulfide isomerase
VERAQSLGVKTTPTIFINDRELAADKRTPNGVRAMIDAALQAQPTR